MKIKLKKKKLILGQSIIEVIVALSLVVIVVLGLVKVAVVSINNAAFARDQQTATKYAQEGLEEARKCKEQDEAAFWSRLCPPLPAIGDVKFERETTYTETEDNQQMHVEVVVFWEDSKGSHKSQLGTYLTRWQ